MEDLKELEKKLNEIKKRVENIKIPDKPIFMNIKIGNC